MNNTEALIKAARRMMTYANVDYVPNTAFDALGTALAAIEQQPTKHSEMDIARVAKAHRAKYLRDFGPHAIQPDFEATAVMYLDGLVKQPTGGGEEKNQKWLCRKHPRIPSLSCLWCYKVTYERAKATGGGEDEPIPAGVYYSEENGNFYAFDTFKGMGLDFWHKWKMRRSEFPTKPVTSPTQPAPVVEAVKMPTHEDEAALMVGLGVEWLKHNAPHRLNKSCPSKTPESGEQGGLSVKNGNQVPVVAAKEALVDIAAKAAWQRDYPNGGSMYKTYESTPLHDQEKYRWEVAPIVAALQSPARVEGWRPINSAPKNKRVLLWCEGEEIVGEAFPFIISSPHPTHKTIEENTGYCWRVNKDAKGIKPTHWMPLPPKPAAG